MRMLKASTGVVKEVLGGGESGDARSVRVTGPIVYATNKTYTLNKELKGIEEREFQSGTIRTL